MAENEKTIPFGGNDPIVGATGLQAVVNLIKEHGGGGSANVTTYDLDKLYFRVWSDPAELNACSYILDGTEHDATAIARLDQIRSDYSQNKPIAGCKIIFQYITNDIGEGQMEWSAQQTATCTYADDSVLIFEDTAWTGNDNITTRKFVFYKYSNLDQNTYKVVVIFDNIKPSAQYPTYKAATYHKKGTLGEGHITLDNGASSCRPGEYLEISGFTNSYGTEIKFISPVVCAAADGYGSVVMVPVHNDGVLNDTIYNTTEMVPCGVSPGY